MHRCRSREAIESIQLILLARGGAGGDGFRSTDEISRRLEVEEVDVDDVLVFRRFKNVERDTMCYTSLFIRGVEKVE
jgi:hypothetical protein